MTTAVKIENLSKKYIIGHQRENQYTTFRDVLMHKFRGAGQRVRHPLSANQEEIRQEELWALRNINLEIHQGERVGIIGSNGAGKSTLLKILSRITEPTEGRFSISGRTASLLEVGTGFHPELSGRENIFLNGAILGMSKVEIKRKFDEIVAFAETERFLDTPVKRYSSGMYVRLAFAVAAHLEPEILIVDEVLAVGDVAFQNKCLGKMRDVGAEGRTVLFISHNMGAIAELCQKVVWIKNGCIESVGKPHEVISEYLSNGLEATGMWSRPINAQPAPDIELINVTVIQNMVATSVVSCGENFRVAIKYNVKKKISNIAIVVQISDSKGTVLFTSWDSDAVEKEFTGLEPGLHQSICTIPSHWLFPGRYSITVAAHKYRIQVFDLQKNIASFEVSDVSFKLNKERQGVIAPILQWEIVSDK